MFGAGPFPIRKVPDAADSEIQVGTGKLLARFIQKNDSKSSRLIFVLDRQGPYKCLDEMLTVPSCERVDHQVNYRNPSLLVHSFYVVEAFSLP